MKGLVLDIGCGKNRLVREYRDRGGFGFGIEVFDWGGLDLMIDDAGRLPLRNGTFDTATMIACINHIPNREEALSEVHRVLKDDGSLVLTNLTPFVSAVWHAYAFWDRDQHERGMQEGEVYGLRKDELETLLRKANFVIREKQGFSWGLNTIYVCTKK